MIATKLPSTVLRGFMSRPGLRIASRWSGPATVRAYSTEGSAPPLLAKIKMDLKVAMRAKDANRLAVLRTVLSATLNASKTDRPIETDAQLVDFLQKTAQKSQDAAEEARKAGRGDLAAKEEEQAQILIKYAASSDLKQISLEELKALIQSFKDKLIAEGLDESKVKGRLMKEFLTNSTTGPLAGVAVDKRMVAHYVSAVSSGKVEDKP